MYLSNKDNNISANAANDTNAIKKAMMIKINLPAPNTESHKNEKNG